MFEIKSLHVNAFDKEILKGVNLSLRPGEIHAIMGPNGAGKSTLASAIMGNAKFEVTKGEILFDGLDVLSLEVDKRARAGIFLAMQSPQEIPGVTNSNFIKTAINCTREQKIGTVEFIKELDRHVAFLQMRKDLPHRYINDGFSGGEKKRNEILQMLMLNPKVVILDEIDSGLDIDGLKIVASAILEQQKKGSAILIITHYQRILDYLNPNFVHILKDGKIVKTGNYDLITHIEKFGYDSLENADAE